MRHTLPLVLALSCAVLTACAGSARLQSFMHPDADLSYYGKVGVVPFRSLASDRFAGEKFVAEFSTALYKSELFEVVDYGIFVNALTQVVGSRSPADGLDSEQLKKIEESTGVNGVFEGTVSQFDMVSTSSGNFPVITVEVRLVDTATGIVVWKATASQKGGPTTPIIGFGESHTLGELAQKLSKKLVKELK